MRESRVHIFGVNVLCFKFLVEVADGGDVSAGNRLNRILPAEWKGMQVTMRNV